MKKPISKTRKPVRATQSPRVTAKPVAESAPAKSDTQGDGAKTISEWSLELRKDRRTIQRALHNWPADGYDARNNPVYCPSTIETALELQAAKAEGRLPTGAPEWVRETSNIVNSFDRGTAVGVILSGQQVPALVAGIAQLVGATPAQIHAMHALATIETWNLAQRTLQMAGHDTGASKHFAAKINFAPPPPAKDADIAKGTALAKKILATVK